MTRRVALLRRVERAFNASGPEVGILAHATFTEPFGGKP